MLVALTLFALIATAGFTVLGQVIRVQAATEGRLGQLASIQRSMYVMTQDFLQAAGGSLAANAQGVGFRRTAGPAEVSVRYALDGSSFVRDISAAPGGPPVRQVLISGVDGLAWRFFAPGRGWLADWRPESGKPPANPAAVALELTLTGPGLAGSLRRVALLPAEATR
jgi:hypothetical protein